MQFSTRLSIATHMLLAIHQFEGMYKTTSTFLAGSVNVNPVIIRNILGQLRTAGIVTVEAGVGGAHLAKPPEEISLLDVFQAVEEQQELFHFHENPNAQCPVGGNIHAVLDDRLQSVATAMKQQLASMSLQAIIDDLNRQLSPQPFSTSD